MEDFLQSGEYKIVETLYSGKYKSVIRARHDGQIYVVKMVRKGAHRTQRHLQEYVIGASIRSPYVADYVEFKRLGYGNALIMKDIGGVPLSQVIPPQGFDMHHFLTLACQIAQGLEAVHNAGVIHKSIKPSNIIVNTQTDQLNIIDFKLSSLLSRNEVLPVVPAEIRKGTLRYMAPEQTGRMNRSVDFRSDLYSVGMTFYEMLTGAPPFNTNDALEMIYKHMTVPPPPLQLTDSVVGPAVTLVISKLIAKNAEDRYQGSSGLLADLSKIQWALARGDSLMPGFEPGANDWSPVLHISQKLYGREEQVHQLIENFKQVCVENSANVLSLVHGYSGVGKTLLVNEVHKPLVEQRGYYITGKFDIANNACPYSALAEAVDHLIQQILTESEERLIEWKKRITEKLGNYGQLIVDIVPSLSLIIGPQPPVPHVGALASLHRLKKIISSFFCALATKEHPIVLFIDDLQWADGTTLDFLEVLVSSKMNYLLIVGAYRDNEVDSNHPLVHAIENIKKKGSTRVIDLPIAPLTVDQVIRLLDDTFEMNKFSQSSDKMDTHTLGMV